MTEPTITCPNCRTEIRLTESLAAPLLAATRAEFEQRIARMDEDAAKREADLRDREKRLADAKRAMDEEIANEVATRLRTERERVIAEEAKKAKLASAAELDARTREIAELRDVLKVNGEKLAEAQQAQADLLRKQRELDDARREFELTLEKRVQAGLAEARAQAKKEAEESLGLKVLEKDQTISSMQRTIEELKRKAEQGSQQLQGEVQELELENMLRARFPLDVIEPVPKGEFGGDVLQRVPSPGGQFCGVILWESKRTRNWSDGWLAKLRDDQRAAKAEIAVLVSQALPKGIDSFDVVDGVWVASPRAALPVATVLRHSLQQIGMARAASEGQQSKTEMVYRYLTGARFRQRVEAIVEAFTSMREDLDKERKAIIKQWAKREAQIERVMESTLGMYGDLQGIAGKSLQEIESLELMALENKSDAA